MNKHFEANMSEIFKDDFKDFINCYNKKYYSGVRFNTLKISEKEFIKKIDVNKKVPWCESGFYYENQELSKNLLYLTGTYYLQEPSAMSPAEFLPVKKGDCVLDMCASPGGKATHLGEKLNGEGLLVANDISNKRARVLARNIEKHGIENYIVLNETQDKLQKAFPNFFDKILVDAPCSGEGMFRKDKGVLNEWTPESPLEYQEIQKSILSSAISMLKAGGYIMYSTCTFNTKENEEVIQWLLGEYDYLEIVDINIDNLFEKGKVEGFERCNRILPFKQEGEGHFLCLLKDTRKSIETKSNNFFKNCKEYDDIVKYFNDNIFTFDLEDYLKKRNLVLHKHENSVFCVSKYLPNTVNKLRIVRSGLLLCDILEKGKKQKIVLSSVFMYPFKYNDFKNVLRLEIEDSNIEKYVKGETIFSDKEIKKGEVVISIGDYPIGYGLNDKGKIKNKYNKNWISN